MTEGLPPSNRDTFRMAGENVEATLKDNVEVVREMLEGYLRGDYEAALPAFAHDVEVLTSLERFHGPAGVVQEAKRWEEMWSDYHFQVEDLVASGDRVVLLYHQVGKARGSGVEVEERAGWVYTLLDGKIARLEMFQDRETALRAAGLDAAAERGSRGRASP
jgi:ketosteroid isomerase-like protein